MLYSTILYYTLPYAGAAGAGVTCKGEGRERWHRVSFYRARARGQLEAALKKRGMCSPGVLLTGVCTPHPRGHTSAAHSSERRLLIVRCLWHLSSHAIGQRALSVSTWAATELGRLAAHWQMCQGDAVLSGTQWYAVGGGYLSPDERGYMRYTAAPRLLAGAASLVSSLVPRPGSSAPDRLALRSHPQPLSCF